MRLRIVLVLGIGLMGASQDADAQWEQAFRTVADSKIHTYQRDSENRQKLFLGIEGGLLSSKDGGTGWKRVLTVPANQPVIVLQQEPGSAKWWAVTPHLLYRSADGGQKWEACSSFAGDASSAVRSFLAVGRELYAGRMDGLAVSDDEGLTWVNAPEFAGQSIYQISETPDHRVWVASDRGVYRSTTHRSWGRVYRRLSVSEEIPDAQSSDESESVTVDEPIYFWFGSEGSDVTVVDGSKKFQIDPASGSMKSSGMLAQPVRNQPRALDARADRVAICAGRGIGLWDESAQSFEELTAGWPGAFVRHLAYDPVGDELSAVTSQGVYKFEHPDINGFLEARVQSSHARAQILTDQFDHEPGILELQQAAMRYAEVHPDKIIAWRRLAAQRAWLPSVSVGQDMDQTNTVDLDRGGTGDPDRFIQGPADTSTQWSFDVSWDLGDLVWSDDQTSIDNRSKLMVQLRDDLLSQLNHLYYSRRRLQLAMIVEGSGGLDKEIDRRLQIEEYTAGLDALTGGYFSRQTGAVVYMEDRSALS